MDRQISRTIDDPTRDAAPPAQSPVPLWAWIAGATVATAVVLLVASFTMFARYHNHFGPLPRASSVDLPSDYLGYVMPVDEFENCVMRGRGHLQLVRYGQGHVLALYTTQREITPNIGDCVSSTVFVEHLRDWNYRFTELEDYRERFRKDMRRYEAERYLMPDRRDL